VKKEKLKVDTKTKRALDAVTKFFNNDFDKILFLHEEAKMKGSTKKWEGKNWSHLNYLSIPQMAQALYVGYEVEKTPKEKALGYYNFLPIENKEVIKTFLEILEYKLEGIN